MLPTRLQSALLCIVAIAPAMGQELPDGKGKEAVQRVCTSCHEMAAVTGSRRTKIGWQQNVDDMISRGAEGSGDDIEAVVDYLTANFGKINVNTATAGELASFLGLSDAEAKAIVTYREQRGKYKDFDQLLKTPGVNAKKLQPKRPQIAFSL
jgi:competence protein ComEA